MGKPKCSLSKPYSQMSESSDEYTLPVHDSARRWLAHVEVKSAVIAARAAEDEYTLEYTL